ncbi:hypothetical protein ACWXWE_07135 [Pantoea ananatis]
MQPETTEPSFALDMRPVPAAILRREALSLLLAGNCTGVTVSR